MNKLIKYFTFKEVLDVFPLYAPNYPNEKRVTSGWFYSMLNDANLQLRFAGINTDGDIIKSESVQVFVNTLTEVLFDRHANDYLYQVVQYGEGCDFSYTLGMDDFRSAISKVINVINLTMPKYIPILYQYLKNYEIPFEKLHSISQSFSRYNDTPQNEQDEVDYNTPDYASNMGHTKNVTDVDSGSLADRMRAFQDVWRSIILEWANEFTSLFIYDIQLEDF